MNMGVKCYCHIQDCSPPFQCWKEVMHALFQLMRFTIYLLRIALPSLSQFISSCKELVSVCNCVLLILKPDNIWFLQIKILLYKPDFGLLTCDKFINLFVNSGAMPIGLYSADMWQFFLTMLLYQSNQFYYMWEPDFPLLFLYQSNHILPISDFQTML